MRWKKNQIITSDQWALRHVIVIFKELFAPTHKEFAIGFQASLLQDTTKPENIRIAIPNIFRKASREIGFLLT